MNSKIPVGVVIAAVVIVIIAYTFILKDVNFAYMRVNAEPAPYFNTSFLWHDTRNSNTTITTIYLPLVVDVHNAPRVYTPPPLSGLQKPGQTMIVDDTMLASMNMPASNFSILGNETIRDFVFVIGASSNHFIESQDAIAGVQTNMPGYKILYYDLGLTQAQITEISSFCDVIYKPFDYSRYPKHVKNLYNYAFKPMIIQDVLTKYRALVWMDASFRLLKSLEVVYPQILETGGYLQFWHSPHSNFAVTDARMYSYIPTQTEKQKTTMSRAAGAVYWHTTHKVYWGILYWWVMCALDENCIAPKKAQLFCNFKHGYRNYFANCHRFDMSALNVLASNLYGYDDRVYTARQQDVVTIVKHKSSMYKLRREQCGVGL